MIQSEILAERYLKENNWNPTKMKTHSLQSGNPDFKCSDNRFVEVKKIGSSFEVIAKSNQVKKWYDLLEDNKKVYLMIFSKRNEYFYLFQLVSKQKTYLKSLSNNIIQKKIGES